MFALPKKVRQPAGKAVRAAGLVLMVVCWFQMWITFVIDVASISAMDTSHADRAAVKLRICGFLVGLVATNLTGFQHYRKLGQKLEAWLALVDADMLYFLAREGRKCVEGSSEPGGPNDTPGLTDTRRRNALWRSVPFAAIQVMYVVHDRTVATGCQALLTLLMTVDRAFRGDVIAHVAGVQGGADEFMPGHIEYLAVWGGLTSGVVTDIWSSACDASRVAVAEAATAEEYQPYASWRGSPQPLAPSGINALVLELTAHSVAVALNVCKEQYGILAAALPSVEVILEWIYSNPTKWKGKRPFLLYQTDASIVFACVNLVNALWGVTEMAISFSQVQSRVGKVVTFAHVLLDGTLHVAALLIGLLIFPFARYWEDVMALVAGIVSKTVHARGPTVIEIFNLAQNNTAVVDVVSGLIAEAQKQAEKYSDEVADKTTEIFTLSNIFLLRFAVTAVVVGCVLSAAAWLASGLHLRSASQVLVTSPLLSLKPPRATGEGEDKEKIRQVVQLLLRLSFQLTVLLLPNLAWKGFRFFVATALNFVPNKAAYNIWLAVHVMLLVMTTLYLVTPNFEEDESEASEKKKKKKRWTKQKKKKQTAKTPSPQASAKAEAPQQQMPALTADQTFTATRASPQAVAKAAAPQQQMPAMTANQAITATRASPQAVAKAAAPQQQMPAMPANRAFTAMRPPPQALGRAAAPQEPLPPIPMGFARSKE